VRTTFALLIASTLGLGCHARQITAVRPAVEEWAEHGLTGRRYVSPRVEFISTLSDHEFELALPGVLESTLDRFEEIVSPKAESSPLLKVILFDTRHQWVQYARRFYPTRFEVYARIRRGGFSEGLTSVSFYTDRASTLATLAHELWHQYVAAHVSGALPAWLNEGLACYHESVAIDGDFVAFVPERNRFRVNSLCDSVQSDTLLALPQLLEVDAGAVISRDDSLLTQTYYAQSWALVAFLRHGANGQFADQFDQMLTDLSNGTLRLNVDAAQLTQTTDVQTSAPSFGRSTFEAYFAKPESLSDAYFDYLVRLCRF